MFDSPCHYNAHCRDGGNAVACVCRLVSHNSFSFFPSIIVLAALTTTFNNRAEVASCKNSTRVGLDLDLSSIGLRLKDVGSSSHHVGSSPRGLPCCEAVLRLFRTSDVGIAAFFSKWICRHERPCASRVRMSRRICTTSFVPR